MIYSTVNYALGAADPSKGKPAAHASAQAILRASSNARFKRSLLPDPKTPAQAAARLEKMSNSLKNWLRLRKSTDGTVATEADARRLFRSRRGDEQILAENLYALLRQAGFPETDLPVPDVALDPNAAVELAELVVSGELPTPAAQGILMLLIPLAAVAWVISRAIQSQADLAAEKEKIRCIESGACTDSGFWLKAGGISVVAYVAWSILKKKKVL